MDLVSATLHHNYMWIADISFALFDIVLCVYFVSFYKYCGILVLAIVDCNSKECNRRGPAGKQCEGCDAKFPTRLACPSCGLNSPVGDYLPDSEAW